MSGETCRPRCSKSSPVLTMNAISSGDSNCVRPSASFAPPTPPVRAMNRSAAISVEQPTVRVCHGHSIALRILTGCTAVVALGGLSVKETRELRGAENTGVQPMGRLVKRGALNGARTTAPAKVQPIEAWTFATATSRPANPAGPSRERFHRAARFAGRAPRPARRTERSLRVNRCSLDEARAEQHS